MDASPLARLSPELRNLIYDHCFDTPHQAITLKPGLIQPALALTCRQLRRETLQLYYTLARFNAHLDDGPATPLAHWFTILGRENVLLLREVNVWDMHMLNATLHGADSTARLLGSLTDEGKRYVLQPTGSWLLNRGWYLKELVVALHPMGLEIRNLSTVEIGAEAAPPVLTPRKPERTSHFALVPVSDDPLSHVPECRHPDLRDLLAHLGFSADMIEEVFDGLTGVTESPTAGKLRAQILYTPLDGPDDAEQREIRIRRGRRDIFLEFSGLDLISTRQTFIPHDEEFTPF
ncbi:hypothetical protein LTR53_009464 [Teratosphaeriaceae sp. CCFEE 6253]|nr:hypothetical protein LTR53_009464 [Teratosphaeriaceae sp. CCFEE 6253]